MVELIRTSTRASVLDGDRRNRPLLVQCGAGALTSRCRQGADHSDLAGDVECQVKNNTNSNALYVMDSASFNTGIATRRDLDADSGAAGFSTGGSSTYIPGRAWRRR